MSGQQPSAGDRPKQAEHEQARRSSFALPERVSAAAAALVEAATARVGPMAGAQNVAAAAAAVAAAAAYQPAGGRSIVTVLSEDNMGAKPAAPAPAPTSGDSQQQPAQAGASFLSKFARAEVRTSKSLEKSSATDATKQMHQKYSSGPAAATGKPFNNESSGLRAQAAASGAREPECDRVPAAGGYVGGKLPAGRTSKSFCELEANRRENLASKLCELGDKSGDKHKRMEKREGVGERERERESEDDDNDQVLPVWPSRMDAASLKPALIQHQVYSLKDYSQVAGPTESVVSSNVTPNSRLLKSMSQDRKVETRMKRMSESILSGVGGTSGFYSGGIVADAKAPVDSRQRNPSVVSKISANNLAEMGPATSVSSLLQPPPSNKSVNLIGESRIDRMRKLFVSPLSLRGGTSSGSPKAAAAAHQAGNTRLSLQAGANMLNKPQHLMHAMYRTRAAVNSHHTRRSPMRQKPGKMKAGFRVYGCPLSMANTMYPITCFGRAEIYKQQSVPYILARLCNYIEENSSQLTHEGIFRVSGNARLMEKLKTLFDHLGDAPLESESVDVATSASMLKMYLRELPDPLIPTRMNHYFFTLAKKYAAYLTKNNPHGSRTSDILTNSGLQAEVSSVSDTQSSIDRQRLAFLRDLTKLIRKLPIENYNLLKYLTCFLHRVALKQHSNKMSAEALGIVFGPNVFRIRSESYKGLKEQELSNQIMASIISNYKLIFDCELTDPLGNLVASSEEPLQTTDRSAKGLGATASDKASGGDDKCLARIKNIAASSPSIPSTSADARAVVEPSSCGVRHARRKARAITSEDLYGDSDDSDDEDEGDEDEDDDEDDDDEDADIDDLDEECDDDGSYSPSSGSGSYCSSLASESVESVYEGDAEVDQYEDEMAADSNTSSRCNSETSYTPSSSHTESDADVDEMSSSQFSSSPSPTKLEGAGGQAGEGAAPGENPCRVCKRRESAQIERLEASKLRDLAAQRSLNVGESSALGDQLADSQGSSSNAAAAAVQKTANRVSSRSSTRKRRSADEQSAVASEKREETPLTAASARDSSDLALARPIKPRSEEKLARTHHHHPQRHQQKQGVLRRRSSSASSLLQIASERHALRKRIVNSKNGHHAHPRAHSDRKRAHINEARSYNRRSRSKNHPGNVRGSQNHAAQARASSSRNVTEWTRGDGQYIPELIAMNLPNEIRNDLVWNYVSSSFLEVPEAERYFQLRSYNSDETLLRSQEAESELVEASKGRRRFSGQELLQTNTTGLLASACPRFSEIFESSEGDNSLEGNRSLDRSSDILQQRAGLSRSNAPAVESSVISLLGDQMISFKHSKLSLDDETDPIVLQLQVTRDFIKILRKLLKHGCSKGFDQDAFNYLVRVIGDFGSDSDDCTTCYVDSITGKSAVMTLDSMKRDFREDTPRVDKNTQERLERLLSFTITSLKKRYNNLRYIREHYRKHCKAAATQQLQQVEPDSSSGGRDKRLTSKTELKQATASTSEPKNHVQQQPTESEAVVEREEALKTKSIDGEDHPMIGANDQSGSGVVEDDTLRQGHESSTATCKYGALCPVEFVYNIEKQLASRRAADGRLIKLDDMSLAQIQSEKLELQKNLLRYEHWFGRPSTRSEFNLVGHLYERYRAIKIIKQNKLASSS